MTKKEFYTDFATAVEFGNFSLVLCNNIINVDDSIYDNMRFSTYDEETECYTEIFQYYITNATSFDVEYLEKTFEDIYFSYSDKLDCFILCVTHWGSDWHYVPCKVKSEEWAKHNKDKEYKH